MKVSWVYVILSILSFTAIEASSRWRRDLETSLPNVTDISISLSTQNDLNEFPYNVSQPDGRPSTMHYSATMRSTTSRTTRPTTSRTTRTTTKRTTVSHTTHHYGRTTQNVSFIDNENPPNFTSSADNEIKESSTAKAIHTTRPHSVTSRITKPSKYVPVSQDNHSTPTPNASTEVEFDYVYEESTPMSFNNKRNNTGIDNAESDKIDKIPSNELNSDEMNIGSDITPGPLPDMVPPTKNLLELLQQMELTTLLEYIKQANMEKVLEGPGPFTIFAPSNKAFDALPFFVSNDFLGNNEKLKDILEYHIVKGALLSPELNNDQTIPTLKPKADIRVNIYPVMEKRKLITATGAHISFANYRATNGIIHVIERVLYRIPELDMVEAISKSSKFKILSDAIEKTILKTQLKEGPFTLFAPTQFAFQRLPAEDRERLLNDKDSLENILKYHVLPGTYYVAALKHGTELPSIEKQILKFSYFSALIRVNNATIVEADIPVTNGVIHAINTILFPPFPNKAAPPGLMTEH